MLVQTEIHEKGLVIRPLGRLDSGSAPDFETQVLEALLGGSTRVVLDLSALEYVSSAGLRVILLAGKKLRGNGGRLLLAGLRSNVREVFDMSGFLQLFPVLPTVDEALATT
jgi:anti-anti-sigma factor